MTHLMLALLVACGGAPTEAPAPAEAEAPAAAAPSGSRTDVSIDQFIEKHGEGVTVVDVRTDAEWNDGHVPGAIHVPLSELSADHPKIAALGKDEPVYFICAVGGRSSRASDMMSKAGFQAVNVDGGTKGWIAKGQPVE